MSLKELNPKECRRWKYADRSSFEMGDLFLLAEDIRQNGQIEPVIVRPLKETGDLKWYWTVIGVQIPIRISRHPFKSHISTLTGSLLLFDISSLKK